MKAVSVSVLKEELLHHSKDELIAICLQLSKFKKENKELLSYHLFYASNEEGYVDQVKKEVDQGFAGLNLNSLYYIKKSTRKILRMIKKYIRYSKKKETEAELLIYFCKKVKEQKPSYKKSQLMINMYQQQLKMAAKAISTLHEDLQFDFKLELDDLMES